MSRSDAFVATVGTLLIENTSSLPWRAPVPPALADAHGWYLPTAAGPRCLFVLKADTLTVEAVEAAIAQWQAWLETMHADESVLMVVWEDGAILDETTFLLPEDGPWPVWLVDLATKSVMRPTIPEEAQLFLVLADTLMGSYLGGTHMATSDLREQETARLSGRPPFSQFLRSQGAPATWGLLAAIAAYFGLTEVAGGSTNISVMLRAGVNYRPLVEHGEWWRLISANFLHFGWMHIAVNAYSLYAVGPMLERLYGTSRYLAIYVLAGITGAIASMAFNGSSSAGASGALFGLIGAMLLTGLRHQDAIPGHFRKDMRNIALVTLVINLAYGFSQAQIDNFAHLGGLVGGFAMAGLVGPNPVLLGQRPKRWEQLALAAFPVLAAVGLACSLVYFFSGKEPEIAAYGPDKAYSVTVPIERYANSKAGDVYLASDDRQHWIGVISHENPYGHVGKQPALSEETLAAYTARLGPLLSDGDKLVGQPSLETHGKHRYLKATIASGSGAPELVFATASPKRVYLIRTNGLAAEAWMKPALERMLDTFDFPTP